jgi:D-amino-acid oxidase
VFVCPLNQTYEPFVDEMQGQVLLVENPRMPMTKQYEQEGQIMLDGMPLKRMHFRSPQRVNKDATYVFPRLPGGGVILGGCRIDNSWDGEVDLEFAEDIKTRCCALAPELGRPENLKVIHHGVGLRRRFLLQNA